jgi:hypothetical protein
MIAVCVNYFAMIVPKPRSFLLLPFLRPVITEYNCRQTEKIDAKLKTIFFKIAKGGSRVTTHPFADNKHRE